MARPWTRPADVRAWLDKRWQSGALLTAFAEGEQWQPLSYPLRGPAAGEIAERLAETQQWAAAGRAGEARTCRVQEGRWPGGGRQPDSLPGLDRRL